MKKPAWILLAGVVLCAVLAHDGMSGLEATIFRHIYDMPGNWRVAVAVTQLGAPWFLLVLTAVLLIVRRNPKLSLLVLRNGVAAYAAAEVLKYIVDRPRPYYLLADTPAREAIVHGTRGFPSGHTALATAVGLTLWPYLPKGWRWLVPLWIVAVAWSRLYLGVHAPLDILGGLGLGALVVMSLPRQALPKLRRKRKLK